MQGEAPGDPEHPLESDLRRLARSSMELEQVDRAQARDRVAAALFGHPSDVPGRDTKGSGGATGNLDDEGDAFPSNADTVVEASGASTSSSSNEIVHCIHRYEVQSKIGSGAMGRVYRAYDPQLARPLAIKVLHPSFSGEDRARARIVREAQALARLSHPNVIQVYDVGDSNEGFFIAMEWVPGETLRQYVKRSAREAWRDIVGLFLDAGEGLAAAHAAGLVHRDFKPENVIVGEDGRVRVLDFGLARPTGPLAGLEEATIEASDGAVTAPRWMGLTQTGALIGTPIYMAPELYRGGVADARSDQFAYCVALFDALYRQRPFSGTSVESYAHSVLSGKMVAPDPGDVPIALYSVLRRGLSTVASARFPDMAALLLEIRHAIAPPRGAWLSRARFGVAAISLFAAVIGYATWTRLPDETAIARPSATLKDGVVENESARVVFQTRSDAAKSKTSPTQGTEDATDESDTSGEDETDAKSEELAKRSGRPRVKGPTRRPAAKARGTDWCSLHEDTYRLIRRERRRRERFVDESGQCYTCRIEDREARTKQFYPRDCFGYQLCGPLDFEQCPN